MDPLLYELFTPAHVHICLGVGPLIASFMFGVLLIEYKEYVYVMVCIYLFCLIILSMSTLLPLVVFMHVQLVHLAHD